MTAITAPIKGETDKHAPMTMTVARAHRGADCIAKTITVAADKARTMKVHEWKGKDGEPKRGPVLPCFKWDITEHAISSADDAWGLLDRLADPAKASCILRGRLPEGVTAMPGAQRLAMHLPRSSNIVAFDLDAVPVKPGMEAADGEAIGAALLDAMPAPWKAAECYVQFTAGHGVKPGWRVRLWFVTRRPLSGRELDIMFGPAAPSLELPWCTERVPVDRSVWAPNQCNYIASPLIRTSAGEPALDHIKERRVIIEAEAGGDSIVDVPSAEEIEAQRVALAMPACVEREWSVVTIPPDKIDGPGVRGEAGRILARAPPLQDAGGRRKAAAVMVFRLMHAGMSAHGSDDAGGALAAVMEWACADRTDPATGEVVPNVAFDGDCSPESLDSYLREALESKTWFDGIIGRDYKPDWEPDYVHPAMSSALTALPPDELEAESAAPGADGEGEGWDTAKKALPRIVFYTSDDEPEMDDAWLIEGVAPAGVGAHFVYGRSGSGKTFFLAGLAAALAGGGGYMGGRNWAGPMGVAYLAAEDHGGLARRVKALRLAGLLREGAPFLHSSLSDPALLGAAVREAKARLDVDYGVALGVVVIDTFRKFFDAEEENGNSEITRIIKAQVEKCAAANNVQIIMAHHEGKGASGTMVGAGAFRDNAISTIRVTGGTDDATGKSEPRAFQVLKIKNAGMGERIGFDLQGVRVGTSPRSGEPVYSAHVVPRALAEAGKPAGTRQPPHHGAILARLGELMALADRGGVPRAVLQVEVAAAAGVAADTIRKAIGALVASGRVIVEGEAKGSKATVRLAPVRATPDVAFAAVLDDDSQEGSTIH